MLLQVARLADAELMPTILDSTAAALQSSSMDAVLTAVKDAPEQVCPDPDTCTNGCGAVCWQHVGEMCVRAWCDFCVYGVTTWVMSPSDMHAAAHVWCVA